MEVKAGYKQTEAGLLPTDWDTTQLGACVKITSGASPSLFRFSGSGIPYFKVEQLSNSEKYLSAADTPYLFERGPIVPAKSVVFAKRGAAISLNKVRILSEESFMDTNLMALTPQVGLDSDYLFYALGFIGLWRFADTTSIPQINNKHIKPLAFPLPTVEEQRAITAVLSDVDALLGGLDRLIAKKRNLKQAAMQQLLTGQSRLPGFREEWEWTKVGSIVREGKQTQRQAGTGIKSGLYKFFTNNTQDDENYLNQFDFEGQAVIANTGGTAFFQYFQGRFAASMHCLILFSEINVKFLYFALKLRELEINESCFQGSGLKVLNKKSLRDLKLIVPRSIEEQSAIADVLTCMDGELDAMQRRREKTALLKQGMMQELLTGRTRLVPREVRNA